MSKIFKTFINLFSTEPNADKALVSFLKNEYKKDWVSAYNTYKEEGRLPNYTRRSL